MTDINRNTQARKHETRAKEHLATIRDLKHELEVSKTRERDWRSAYHSLRLTLENRLDHIAEILEIDYADEEGATK